MITFLCTLGATAVAALAAVGIYTEAHRLPDQP
jgi:hypothetical protein